MIVVFKSLGFLWGRGFLTDPLSHRQIFGLKQAPTEEEKFKISVDFNM